MLCALIGFTAYKILPSRVFTVYVVESYQTVKQDQIILSAYLIHPFLIYVTSFIVTYAVLTNFLKVFMKNTEKTSLNMVREPIVGHHQYLNISCFYR